MFSIQLSHAGESILPTSLIIAASVVTQGRRELIGDWNTRGSKRSLQPLDMIAVICKKISTLKMHIMLGDQL
jgi:hypothetical protein